MKRFLLVFVIVTFSAGLHAQPAAAIKTADTDKVFTTPVEIMPEFEGGMQQFYSRLENIRYMFLDRMNNIEGRILVLLVVEKDGTISNIKVAHGLTRAQDDEVIRVISRLKRWRPGLHEGKPVRVQYAIPINFQLAKL
jgi:protein TonB